MSTRAALVLAAGAALVLYAAWLSLAVVALVAWPGPPDPGTMPAAPPTRRTPPTEVAAASTGVPRPPSPTRRAERTPGVEPAPDALPGTSDLAPPTPSPSAPRVTATPFPPGPTPVPPVDWPELADVEDRAAGATTEHFQVYAESADDPFLASAVERWAPVLEPTLADVSARLGGRALPAAPLNVVFTRAYDARCPARGLAATAEEPPLVMIFLDEGTPDIQVRAVLAHELAHHLTLDDRFVGDGILTEGIANWAAGDVMLAWQGYPSWDAAVRDLLARGDYVSITDGAPLSPRRDEDCIARRDRVYNARTAFVDWLVGQIGLDTVLAMPYVEVESLPEEDTDEPRVHRVPDYVAATGVDLAALERLWLRDVTRARRPEAEANG